MGAGDVGPGRPTVGAPTTSMTTSSESTLADQPRDAAGIDPVQEPMYDYGSNSNSVAFRADYVKVVEDTPVLSAPEM